MRRRTPLHVVGIDPSMTSTGVAIVNLVEGQVSVFKAKSQGHLGDSLDTRRRRMRSLRQNILSTIPVDALVVIEGPAYAKGNRGTWDRAGLWWGLVDHLMDDVHARPVVLCPPTVRAKYATGKGNAGKDDVLQAVTRRYPAISFQGNDEADALVMAAMGARLLGVPLESSLPTPHLKAMAGLEIPDDTMGAWPWAN